MDVAAAFVADVEAAELVDPGEAAFDDPAPAAESGAVLGLAAGDAAGDAALAQSAAVFLVVVAAVGDEQVGPAAGSAGASVDGRDAVEQRLELGDVVTVGARQYPGERDTACVDEEVVLGARAAAVDRARARRGAPFLACTWLESAIARLQSSAPAWCSSSKSSACSFSHTPARCQASKRRQQVTPAPKPNSCGTCRHATPVCSTYRIPHSAARSDAGLRPG